MRPGGPALWLGGQRRRGIALAARFAEGWIMPGNRAGDVDYFVDRRDALRRALEEAGRDPAAFSFAGQLNVRPAPRAGAEAREQGLAFLRAGADHVTLGIVAREGPSALGDGPRGRRADPRGRRPSLRSATGASRGRRLNARVRRMIGSARSVTVRYLAYSGAATENFFHPASSSGPAEGRRGDADAPAIPELDRRLRVARARLYSQLGLRADPASEAITSQLPAPSST